tara:strand:- start:4 stop:366 length:363 start_codon:yes stop_codon:yes gene_type:complete
MAKFQDSNNRLHTGSEYATTGVTQAASLAVKTSAGLFFGVSGYNNTSSTVYITIHDVASLGTAAAANVKYFLVANANQGFGLSVTNHGIHFSSGIQVKAWTDLACTSATSTTNIITVEYL